jgi:hypothetical protein
METAELIVIGAIHNKPLEYNSIVRVRQAPV